MINKLSSDDELRSGCEYATRTYSKRPEYHQWLTDLKSHIVSVQAADHDVFVSEAFQQKLWDSEAVSATGLGTIDVSLVAKNKEIAELLWDFRNSSLPEALSERAQHLIKSWDDIWALMEPLVNHRTPRLKMYRVFAALKPTEFTTIAHASKLKSLARAMGIGIDHPIVLHRRVLDRLTEVVGATQSVPQTDGIERMTLPWLLFAATFQEQGDDATGVMGAVAGSEELKPLPADRRRRGMLAMKGFIPSIRSMIEFAKDGCNREDFREHIRSINPNLAEGSIGTNLNALIAEWGVLRAVGNDLSLTPRGEALLESGDPQEVSDWLLTRILGFDNLLFALKNASTVLHTNDIVAVLQQANPGWTTSFAPVVMINWVRAIGLIEADKNKNLQLTDEGRSWAARIHWVPQCLPVINKVSSNLTEHLVDATSSTAVQHPSVSEVISAFPKSTVFPDALIARLNAGVWLNERRHFAVLTGLSGAGKTLLARNYGLALSAGSENPEKRLYTLPVQPGWHDPSNLLGYVNPLSNNAYVRTFFLDFLLLASGDPTRPYTVVLDEMNLSHPEQYLAPLLSAMETGADIELHPSEEEISGVPPTIPYPNNLVIIGTVNMDETTHGLSDKILDRASVIEFWDVDVHAYPGWADCDLGEQTVTLVRTALTKLGAALRPVRLHFGWRAIGDIVGHVQSAQTGGILDPKTALDHAIYAKILPKLRGEDTPRLRTAFANALAVLKESELNESHGKLTELADDLTYTGSARFWR